ncbi:hypothetical protein CEXT_312961 [Caerostris extrusa]|uniref:Uncharacterized protein n=1 Tax=Caerostris extrusa TaxID=172846 RepID=A0AAV4MAE2_CAEEX|nr:hypothetical protein CEXT_312961 [Caerostris extrusa]
MRLASRKIFETPNFLNNVEITTNLNLAQPTLKSQLPLENLQILALETIHIRHPKPERLHIYADASLIDSPNIGSGIYSIFLSVLIAMCVDEQQLIPKTPLQQSGFDVGLRDCHSGYRVI